MYKIGLLILEALLREMFLKPFKPLRCWLPWLLKTPVEPTGYKIEDPLKSSHYSNDPFFIDVSVRNQPPLWINIIHENMVIDLTMI